MEYLFISWKELKCPKEYEIMKSYAENTRQFILLYSGEDYHWIIHYIYTDFITFLIYLNDVSYISTLQYISAYQFLYFYRCLSYRSCSM